MSAIIAVEGVSKKFIISHEGKERYNALRDVMAKKAKNILALGKPGRDAVTKEEFWALNNISFDIKQGERVGIIGRNGAGKSTLLKVLSRITEPTAGRITIKGRVASLLEVGTGFHPELTGRENVFLNGAILGMSRTEIRKKFDEIVAFAEVEKFLDTPVKRYSSGMYVRLAFAVAAHLEPEILIVDEVLAVGDAQFQKKCLGKMEDVSKNEGRTVLFVSHNMGTILQLCQRAILLNKGTVESMGDAPTIVERYYSSASAPAEKKEQSAEDIFLKHFYTCDEEGRPKINFGHREPIRMRLHIGVNKYTDVQNIGICLLRQDKKRVFTVNKKLSHFYSGDAKEVTVDFIIPAGLIAPMDYSFLVALNAQNGNYTYEWQEDVCPIKVYDDGTDFSFQEGWDYGCVIIKDEWQLINQ
jgi:lipopolysaccharide transport system ATP-binding protein